LACEIEDRPLRGEFDPVAILEALKALTEEAVNSLPSRDTGEVSLHARREANVEAGGVVIEWRGIKLAGRNHSLRSTESHGTVYTAQAARIIEAHGGRFECDTNTIRAWLPLSE
jgi:hypothetical protein